MLSAMKHEKLYKSSAARVYFTRGIYLARIKTPQGYRDKTFRTLAAANDCARAAEKQARALGAEYAIPLDKNERAIIGAYRTAVADCDKAKVVASAVLATIERVAASFGRRSLADYGQAFVDDVSRNCSPGAARRAEQRIGGIVDALDCFGADSVVNLNAENAASALAEITREFATTTRREWYQTAKRFFAFVARRAGLQETPIDVPARRRERNRVETLSNEQAAALIESAAKKCPNALTAIAIQLFAGTRAAEAIRLRFSDIRGNEIFLSREVTKTAQARRVPVPANVSALLAAERSRRGDNALVFDCGDDNASEATRSAYYCRALKTLGKLPRNVLRKTAISNYCALVGNAKAADICGNSIATQGEYYRDLKSADDAREFFAIRVPCVN